MRFKTTNSSVWEEESWLCRGQGTKLRELWLSEPVIVPWLSAELMNPKLCYHRFGSRSKGEISPEGFAFSQLISPDLKLCPLLGLTCEGDLDKLEHIQGKKMQRCETISY